MLNWLLSCRITFEFGAGLNWLDSDSQNKLSAVKELYQVVKIVKISLYAKKKLLIWINITLFQKQNFFNNVQL